MRGPIRFAGFSGMLIGLPLGVALFAAAPGRFVQVAQWVLGASP